MSLKAFHIVFVVLSTIFTLGFGVWSFWSFSERGGTSLLLGGIGSIVGVGVLLVYGRWFLKKLENVSYL